MTRGAAALDLRATARALLLCLVWVAALFGPVLQPARAETLARVQQAALPAPAGPVAWLVSSGGTLLAGDGAKGWQLDAEGRRWTPLPWSLPAGMTGVLGGSDAAYLLAGDAASPGRATRLWRVSPEGLQAQPDLPRPLRDVQGSVAGAVVMITGLDDESRPRVYRLAAGQWAERPAWPSTAGAAPASALFEQGGALYAVLPGPRAEQRADQIWRWLPAEGWRLRSAAPGRVLPGSGRVTGQAHLAFALAPPAGAASVRWMTWQSITNAWAPLAELPASAGTGSVTPWRRGIAWVAAGGAAPVQIETAEIEPGRHLLKGLDWGVIVIYLAAMMAIGGWFYLREKRQSTADFFVGGRSIPFWAAGISLYATNTSSISYIAIPAKAFETNWTYMTNNLVAVCGLMFVAAWVVPLLRRLDLMSVFQYLELRFHPAIRTLASALCVLVQIGSRLSVVLYLPALAIATITGLDVVWSVLLMGGFTIAYTALGGMKAVIWTDVAQLVVMAGGAFFAIGFIVWHLDGGWATFAAEAAAADKTKLFDFSFDLTKATVWGFIFLVLFDVVLTFPKDQVLMQRVLSTSSDREAGRSIWAFAAIMIPGGFVFYGIGTALYAYYRAHPERMDPTLSIDATFPLFIAAELPAGLTGLIIAGIFAAAMSTLSSIINSVATLISVDFYEKLVREPDPQTSVRVAEWMSVAVGLVGIGAALVLSRFDIRSLFDVSIELAGLLGGGFAGAYTLGMFTRRANSAGVAIGIGSAIVLTTVAWSMDLVHPYFYLAISILLCIVIGYVASLAFPAPTRSLKGLTIHRQDRVDG